MRIGETVLALTPGGLVDKRSRAVKESQIDDAGSQLRRAGVKVRLGPECSQSKKSTTTKTAAEHSKSLKLNKGRPDCTRAFLALNTPCPYGGASSELSRPLLAEQQVQLSAPLNFFWRKYSLEYYLIAEITKTSQTRWRELRNHRGNRVDKELVG